MLIYPLVGILECIRISWNSINNSFILLKTIWGTRSWIPFYSIFLVAYRDISQVSQPGWSKIINSKFTFLLQLLLVIIIIINQLKVFSITCLPHHLQFTYNIVHPKINSFSKPLRGSSRSTSHALKMPYKTTVRI